MTEPRVSDEQLHNDIASYGENTFQRAYCDDLRDCRARCEELEAGWAAANDHIEQVHMDLEAAQRERDEARAVRPETARARLIRERDNAWNERDSLAAQLAERDGQVAVLREALDKNLQWIGAPPVGPESFDSLREDGWREGQAALADTAAAAAAYHQRIRAEACAEQMQRDQAILNQFKIPALLLNVASLPTKEQP